MMPQRTALITRELACYHIDIYALSETTLTEGLIAKPKGGNTFFRKGKAENKDRIHGVAIRTTLLHQLPVLPAYINE